MLSTFENHCLAGELTFGDPLQDSGVVRRPTVGWELAWWDGLKFRDGEWLDRSRYTVEGFVPHTQHGNLIIVSNRLSPMPDGSSPGGTG